MTDATPEPREPGRNGHGEFARTVEDQSRTTGHVEAYYRLGTYRKAAKERGVTASAIYRAHMRALAEAGPVATVNEVRSQSLVELDEAIALLWPVARGRHPLFHRGARVEGARDFGPNVAAIREIRLLNESRRRLAGADAPQQVSVTVRDEVSAEIAQLLDELGIPDPALLVE